MLHINTINQKTITCVYEATSVLPDMWAFKTRGCSKALMPFWSDYTEKHVTNPKIIWCNDLKSDSRSILDSPCVLTLLSDSIVRPQPVCAIYVPTMWVKSVPHHVNHTFIVIPSQVFFFFLNSFLNYTLILMH